MKKLRQPFIFLSHFFSVWGFLKINVSDKYPFLKNFSACEIPGRMSLILLYEPQLSERLVSMWVKHQPLWSFATAWGRVSSAGVVQKCPSGCSSPSPWREGALLGTLLRLPKLHCWPLQLAKQLRFWKEQKWFISSPPSPWAPYPAWRGRTVSVKYVAVTHVGSARVNFKLASIGHW